MTTLILIAVMERKQLAALNEKLALLKLNILSFPANPPGRNSVSAMPPWYLHADFERDQGFV